MQQNEHIKVVIRFRPFNEKENQNIGEFLEIKDNSVIVKDNTTTQQFFSIKFFLVKLVKMTFLII